MTPKEISKQVSELDDPQKFDNISLTFNIINNNSKTITGLASIHEFIYNQKQGWFKFERIPQILDEHRKFCNSLLPIVERFFLDNINRNKDSVRQNWIRIKDNNALIRYSTFPPINISKSYFLYNDPSIEFLIDISNKFSNDIVNHTYNSISNETNSKRERDKIIGEILAYEFIHKDTDITERRKREKQSLNKLRADLSNSLDGARENLHEFYKESKDTINMSAQEINQIKTEKSNMFNDWYSKTTEDYDNWNSTTKEKYIDWYTSVEKKIDELENTYQEKLRLSEPVKYWNTRAEDLRKRGDNARVWLIGLIVFTVLFLIVYICIAPNGLIVNIIKGNTDSMKWLLVSITIISFLAYGIRSFNKVMFSSYHLARDAEEREQLTYVYLSLYNDKKIDETERSIVLQSIFSRADTGLLKEDSSPTMPGIIMDKLTNH